jgi:hypothetical protein
MVDEIYYSEPITGNQTLASTDQRVARYECVPDAMPLTL